MASPLIGVRGHIGSDTRVFDRARVRVGTLGTAVPAGDIEACPIGYAGRLEFELRIHVHASVPDCAISTTASSGERRVGESRPGVGGGGRRRAAVVRSPDGGVPPRHRRRCLLPPGPAGIRATLPSLLPPLVESRQHRVYKSIR